MSGIVAIVGRPNVGKSALFNRLAGRRIAIVHNLPGVTRDRISAEAEWRGRPYTLLDTGGIGLLRGEKATDVIVNAAVEQVGMAIESAQVIILVVNAQEGVVPLDREVAQRLRRAGKPVIVAVNKVDHSGLEPNVTEFSELGFEKLLPVSAIHERGTSALADAAVALLPVEAPLPERVEGDEEPAPLPPVPGPLKLAVVGRPNVGKSSIINALTQSSRVIVSPIPGTTRDSVDVPLEVVTDGVSQKYLLIDTAGIRKTRRVDDSIEFFSVKRAEDSIDRSDITIMVLDAEAGILEQDKKIADKIVEARKACILVVNKWDLFEEQIDEALERAKRPTGRGHRTGQAKPLTSLDAFGKWVQEKLFFLDYAPVIFTSAKTGFHLERLLEAVRYVAAQLQQKVPTAILNRTLNDSIERRQPVSATGARLKFFYATQVRQAPPTFLLFVNRDELFSPAYNKYLIGELRRAFGFEGAPIVLVPKPRPKTVENVKKRSLSRKGGGPRRPAVRDRSARTSTRRPAGPARRGARP
ncbi:MAG: ribosome biogenesis GTPase Der [Limisphaerales bacterium]